MTGGYTKLIRQKPLDTTASAGLTVESDCRLQILTLRLCADDQELSADSQSDLHQSEPTASPPPTAAADIPVPKSRRKARRRPAPAMPCSSEDEEELDEQEMLERLIISHESKVGKIWGSSMGVE